MTGELSSCFQPLFKHLRQNRRLMKNSGKARLVSRSNIHAHSVDDLTELLDLRRVRLVVQIMRIRGEPTQDDEVSAGEFHPISSMIGLATP